MTFEWPAFTATGMVHPDIRPAPGLSGHTRAVVSELGLDAAAVDDLIARGGVEASKLG